MVALDVPRREHVRRDRDRDRRCRASARCTSGYSMGGRLALRLALDRPELVHGARARQRDRRHRRRSRARANASRADEALAESVERDGVDAFLEQLARATVVRDRSARRARAARTPRVSRRATSRIACACSARARWSRCGTGSPSSRCRSRSSPARTDAKYEKIALHDARTHARRRGARAARRRSRAAARTARGARRLHRLVRGRTRHG